MFSIRFFFKFCRFLILIFFKEIDIKWITDVYIIYKVKGIKATDIILNSIS